jgi:hypothetical protein
MRSSLTVAALLCLAAAPGLLWSGAWVISDITISGGDLAAPAQITDSAVIRKFSPFAGPASGTTSNGVFVPYSKAGGFVADWARGTVAAPGNAVLYAVQFHSSAPEHSYRLRYAVDRSSGETFVYFPGKGEPEYGENVSMVLHRIEGNWFHAWLDWDKVAKPLIADARGR